VSAPRGRGSPTGRERVGGAERGVLHALGEGGARLWGAPRSPDGTGRPGAGRPAPALGNDGAFHLLQSWDAEAVMTLFREGLLARLVERHAISEDLARKLVAWTHPGFSSHIAEAIPFENKKVIEDLACYLVRAPLCQSRPRRTAG
jgi:hypothetical protein